MDLKTFVFPDFVGLLDQQSNTGLMLVKNTNIGQ
jgi:hypothetical protein